MRVVLTENPSVARELASFLCAGIEDPPYLEQKYATLMAAVELLLRNALHEDGRLPGKDIDKLTILDLIGQGRKLLKWDIPRHYTEKDRTRPTRNAVAHGGALPYSSEIVRDEFDKWHLFLVRRFLLRLGYDGEVVSPENGFASSSKVDDFSELNNKFGR